MSNDTNGSWMSTAEVTEELDISKSSVIRLVKRGLLVGHKITPGTLRSSYRISRQSVERYKDLYRK